ncbi:MAG: hypothetical protein KGJ62_13660 [Armatimonadetes bacterium]|nr:hypothetical protein [Armatimonadota bacterium]MDE2206224.1 hypothetical protein [Armatimonadota bacterium]
MKRLLRCLSFVLACALLAPAALANEKVDVAAHGKRFTIGAGASTLTVLYLKGTPYQMGYAQGKLCAKEIRYMAEDVAKVMLMGLGYSPERALAVFNTDYRKHLRPDYLDEMRGLADGSGVPLKDIEIGVSIPDISEWNCTFFAAFGSATKTGDLIQMRALDYTTDAGIQKYPALVVYDPTNGVPFVNVTWLGQVGVVTGMNADGIAMSEIGDDWNKATDDFNGRPLNFVMRDSVQFGRNLQEAVNLVKDGPRTTSLLYCLSSGPERQVRALKTSHTQCIVFTPSTLPYKTQPHMVYMSMGCDSPWNAKVGDWLNNAYGQLNVHAAMKLMGTLHTGSLHAVVMKPETGDIWVANATATQKAYTQPYHHLNLKAALADPFFKAAHIASK